MIQNIEVTSVNERKEIWDPLYHAGQRQASL